MCWRPIRALSCLQSPEGGRVDRADLEEGSLARRLYYPELTAADSLELGEAAAQHARVLRLTPGDKVELFDGRGHTLHGAHRAAG